MNQYLSYFGSVLLDQLSMSIDVEQEMQGRWAHYLKSDFEQFTCREPGTTRIPWLAEGFIFVVLLGLGNGFEDNGTCTGGAEVGHFLQLLPLQSRLGMPCLPAFRPACRPGLWPALRAAAWFALPACLSAACRLPAWGCLFAVFCLWFFLGTAFPEVRSQAHISARMWTRFLSGWLMYQTLAVGCSNM